MFLYACAVAKRLLAIKRVQWRDSVFRIAPKPLSRRPVTCPVSSPEVGRSVSTRGEISPDNRSVHTDDQEQRFYDAESDQVWLATASEQGSSTTVEEEEIVHMESPQHSAVNIGDIELMEADSEDVDSVSFQDEAVVIEDPARQSGNGVPVIRAHETNDHSASLHVTRDLQAVEVTREISGQSVAKLRLLKKLIKKKVIYKQCKVNVNLADEVVTLTGTEDDVISTKISVYEALTKASERSLNISRELGCLITLPKGQQWFDESCDQHSFIGVCYLDCSVTKLLAADDGMVDGMRKWIGDALLSERISLESHHLSFLKTTSWKDFVRTLMDSQLVVITEDTSKNEIFVGGLADAVKAAVKKIDDLLNTQCHINKKLPLKPAHFRTLAFRSLEIVNEVQDLVVQPQR